MSIMVSLLLVPLKYANGEAKIIIKEDTFSM